VPGISACPLPTAEDIGSGDTCRAEEKPRLPKASTPGRRRPPQAGDTRDADSQRTVVHLNCVCAKHQKTADTLPLNWRKGEGWLLAVRTYLCIPEHRLRYAVLCCAAYSIRLPLHCSVARQQAQRKLHAGGHGGSICQLHSC
jgi:hypothetical protein